MGRCPLRAELRFLVTGTFTAWLVRICQWKTGQLAPRHSASESHLLREHVVREHLPKQIDRLLDILHLEPEYRRDDLRDLIQVLRVVEQREQEQQFRIGVLQLPIEFVLFRDEVAQPFREDDVDVARVLVVAGNEEGCQIEVYWRLSSGLQGEVRSHGDDECDRELDEVDGDVRDWQISGD